MKTSSGVILNKYGALTEIELHKIWKRIELLECQIKAIVQETGIGFYDQGEFKDTFKKMRKLTNADDYEYITETKLIKKENREGKR